MKKMSKTHTSVRVQTHAMSRSRILFRHFRTPARIWQCCATKAKLGDSKWRLEWNLRVREVAFVTSLAYLMYLYDPALQTPRLVISLSNILRQTCIMPNHVI